ncbi:MAG TPA: hypothetical protein VM238_03125 [Phycisphaerae bacterium]|nr:hypothetical protein [Phycisphaerae bacterium]
MLTNGQKKALHVAARRLGLPDDVRRMVQWNAGGFYSAADATASREGFIAVMAVYEARSGGQMPGCTEGYWQAEDRKANPADALRFLVRKAAAELGLDDAAADRFIAGERMSRGGCDGVADATPYWLRRCLEAFKAMRRRGWRAAADRRETVGR